MGVLFWVAHRIVMSLIRSSPFGKFLLWRIYNKGIETLGRSYRARTYFGASMTCDIRDYIQCMIFYFGFWEPTLSRFVESRLREGDCFVDLGANVGYYSLLARSCVGANGCVVAVEAAPEIFLLLKDNLILNGTANIRAVNMAVADHVGSVLIYPGPPHNIGRASSVRYDSDVGPGHRAESAPLGHILTDEERRRVRLIKMDVEGGEAPILADILRNIEDYPEHMEILVELSGQNGIDFDEQDRLFQRFFEAGFHAYRYSNPYSFKWYLNWRKPAEPEPISAYPVEQSDVLFTRSQNLANLMRARPSRY